MAGPWEKFQAPVNGPWSKFGNSDASVAGVPGADPAALDGNRNLGKSAPSSDGIMGKIAGIVEPAIALGSGAIAAPLGALAGMGKSIVGGNFGTQKGVRQGEEFGGKVADALTYQPRTQTGQDLTQKLGEVVQDSGIVGLPIGPELNAMTRLAVPATRQAVTSPAVKSTLSAARQAVEPEVFMAKNIATKLGKAKVLPTIDQGTAQLADKAAQFGLILTPDMLANNKIMRIAGEAAGKVPLSGAPNEANQIAFNRSLIKMIGGDESAKALTPDVYGDALHSAGEKIGEIAGKTHIPLDDGFSSALASHLDDVAKFQTEGVAKVVNSYVTELQNKAAANGGVIDGTAFRTLNTKIGRQIRGTTDGDLRSALGGLQETMQDAVQRNIASPEDMAALLDARKKYAIAKTIEPLVAKSPTGDISPAGLMGRVTSNSLGKTTMATGGAGELGDLARVGQRFLKEPGSSNTAERNLVYGIAGGASGAGAIASLPATLATAGGVYTAANLYNRLGPLLARRIVKNSLPDPVPPVSFPSALGLAEESPFGVKATPQPAPPPYRGLLELASPDDAVYSIGGHGKQSGWTGEMPVDPNMQLLPETTRVLEPGFAAKTNEWMGNFFGGNQSGINFPTRQGQVSILRNEYQRKINQMHEIAQNAATPTKRAYAEQAVRDLQAEFAGKMRDLGVTSAADAHGLNRPLFESGSGTRLPIQKTFDPRRGLLDQ